MRLEGEDGKPFRQSSQNMITLPTNLTDIESLVHNQVPESIHLDYKASPALDPKKRDAIAIDVSAFANTDGGLLIYGVEEDETSHLPLQIDDGVDPKWNRERLEQIIASNVNPRIDGIEIRQFVLPNGNSVFCVQVPKSYRGPHQAGDNKYHKRFNFSSFPMEHYEVEDVRARAQTIPALVLLDLNPPSENFLPFVLRNVGSVPARNLSFNWSPDMKWPSGSPPTQFVRGISFLAPGKVFEILCHGQAKIFDWKATGEVLKFDITVCYQPGTSSQKITDEFHFDIADYRGTSLLSKDAEKIEHHASEISRRLGDLARAVEGFSLQQRAQLQNSR
jgi:hypothetical protein